ncbi:uncharacterized protein TRAVEDRAFT_46043 [Trametes versicolor FP-101664 SS1]|uniref:uncharacterized protein n=1 Tax=Trametes versicolor (strain FP-101664) TaxID=717944 RepID=UPI00046222BE|nr:uncharacterized protein TRAVEDRAFT_46043 [Trametes versicolor FP-101664 SS1]EIW60802.1 hypothetical protein TRAVEDRAFT_46043 [Trametes versicolor FP-101664 SS1]
MPSETSLGSLIITPRCSVCGIPESHLEGKLKRCAGCSATVYCSKECQKQAWSKHKVSCRAKWKEDEPPAPNDINSPVPSDSVAALDHALSVWIGIHHYPLLVIATATVCLQGGYALHFSPDSSLAIGFAVHPLPKFVASLLSGAGTPDDNPGTGFHLVNALSVSKDKILKDCSPAGTEGALDWEGVVSACQVVSADLLSKTEVDPATLGALPGIFSIKHSPVLRIQPVVVFRLPQDRGETLDEETHAVFEDIRVLCVTMMAAGLVLRPPSVERVNTSCPDVGTLVRRKKKQWEWERIPDWDWGRAALMVPRELRKTDLHPKELWASFLSQSAWTVEQVMPKTCKPRAAEAGGGAGALVARGFATLMGSLVLWMRV